MMSIAAFNALLKTLEEPPGHAIFVLATTEEHKVPLTIKSRCQQFNFRLLTTQEISGRLRWLAEQEGLTLDEAAVTMIAQHASGSIRDAESLLDQLVAAPGDRITIDRARTVLGTASNEAVSDLTAALIAGDGQGGLSIIHSALATGADARQFSRQMVSYLRQVLLIATAGHDLPFDLTAEQRAMMVKQAEEAKRSFLIEAVKRFNTAATIPTGSWQPQLPLELAFIELLPAQPSHVKSENVVATQVDLPGDNIKIEPEKVQSTPAVTLDDKPAAEEKKPEKPATLAGTPETVTLESIKAFWPELRERVGKRDSNLPALLASSKPLAAEGTMLILGFDYPILKEKFERKKQASDIVALELSELTGSKITLRTVVTDQYVPPVPQESINKDDFSALAQELGGVVSDQ
jgi:DNA polymerase-3 subunit gamma/tau